MSGANSQLHTTIKQAEAELERFETQVVTAVLVTVPLAIAGLVSPRLSLSRRAIRHRPLIEPRFS
jgi:hypothetical protein